MNQVRVCLRRLVSLCVCEQAHANVSVACVLEYGGKVQTRSEKDKLFFALKFRRVNETNFGRVFYCMRQSIGHIRLKNCLSAKIVRNTLALHFLDIKYTLWYQALKAQVVKNSP